MRDFLRSVWHQLRHNEDGVITAGLFGLQIEKHFVGGTTESMEAEDNKELLTTDTYTPDFTLHDFRDDVTNEVVGTNYTSGGVAVTSTEITLSGGLLTYDQADTVYTNVTISSVMAGVWYALVGTAATDQLWAVQDFTTAASATAADFTIQHAGGGVFTLDYTP